MADANASRNNKEIGKIEALLSQSLLVSTAQKEQIKKLLPQMSEAELKAINNLLAGEKKVIQTAFQRLIEREGQAGIAKITDLLTKGQKLVMESKENKQKDLDQEKLAELASELE